MKKRKSILTKTESRVLIGLFIAVILVVLFFVIDISTYPGNIY
jgi:cell division protein FtsL